MNREGKKCVLYPRVSTEMQVDGYSLEGQKNGLKRFADREEMEIVGIYEDAGKSGKSIEGRPAFKKMLSDIKNGLEIDYILVYKLSRFGRNAADILNSLEFVQSYGINLICIEEGIDSSQTSGKLLISVLSAVAEIERENIIEQTMNGRREKARQGGWNGGFAPYGYYLKDNQLLIEETEAEAIRIIFDKFANSDIGLGGVAKYLNLQGIKKIPRQNGTLETWSSHFIRLILDNPVYCGKIAYGRRTREKVKGTKNEYKQVHAEDYILEDGQHEGIISEELWQKVHAKRMATGIKQPSKIGKDRSHLLTGILKCPLCGSSMYTNKHAWTNKDGTYKEVYYYICGRNKQERGHHCDYKASLRKTDIEPLVIEAVKELVSDKYFAKEIEKRIGVQTDTTAIDKELANYESKLKEVDLNKARLEREIDNLPVDTRFRERKIHDMTLRLDALYDTIVELEERIEDAKLRKSSIEMETITLDNIYKLMLNFGKLYDIISDEEKKSLITYLIKEIQIYPNGESEQPLKSIEFNFPIYRDGQEVRRLLWEKGNTVDGRVIAGKCISRPLLRIVQRSWQIPCVCRHACRVVQYRGFACALARGGFQFLRVPRVFQLLRIARERTSVHVRRQAVRGLLQRGRGLPALLVRVRHCQLLVNGHAQPACVQHPRVHVVCDIPAVGGIVCALYRALAVRAQRIVGVCVLFIPLRLPFAFGRCHLRGFLHTPPCGGKRVRPELPEALQLQIRPFVCQRRVFRLCGAAAEPAACRLPRLLPGNCRRVRPELPEALQLQVRPFVCQCRVCGRLFARGRSGFAALRLDQLHQIGRLRPAKSAGSRIFPRRARFFVAFFHTFLHLFPPFQAAFRRSRAAVIMPVQSDTPAAAPRFYRGSHIARSCR